MIKNRSITIRLSDKTYGRIESIRKQFINKGFPDVEKLTDSYIVREAISVLDNKMKYLIYEFEIKDLK